MGRKVTVVMRRGCLVVYREATAGEMRAPYTTHGLSSKEDCFAESSKRI